MGVGYNPRIVTDGLVLCLDAANPRSAPTTAIESAVVSSVTGSGPSYNVVYTTNVSAARVGDKVNVEKREAGAGTSSTVLSTYTYEITGLDRSLNQLTLTYESDTASLGDDSPADLPSGGGSSGSPEIAPHDIVSLWIDMKGGNNGTPTNGPTFSGDNAGSLVFDGANDYINVGNNSDLQITSEITLSAWIKGSPQSNKGIAGKYSATAGQRGYLITTQQASPYNKITWNYQRATSTFNVGDSVTSSLNVLDSNWHFILCTFTPSVSAKIYIDGELNATDTVDIQSAIANNSTRFDIGIHDQSTVNSFNGNISNVSVYNRALTADEVRQNYEATAGRFS